MSLNCGEPLGKGTVVFVKGWSKLARRIFLDFIKMQLLKIQPVGNASTPRKSPPPDGLYRLSVAILALLAFSCNSVFSTSPTSAACSEMSADRDDESKIEVVVTDPNLEIPDSSGRLLVAFATGNNRPRFTDASFPGQPMFGMTVDKLLRNEPIVVDDSATGFPVGMEIAKLPPGQYKVQAIFMHNRSINLPNAPGNLRSEVVDVNWPLPPGETLSIPLTEALTPRPSREREGYELVEIPSPLLTAFHGRPMTLRFGVALPLEPETIDETDKDLSTSSSPQIPKGLIIHIGGFGQRSTSALGLERDSRFVQILLDGAGPFGDPYYVDSDNNGPYGQALLEELIPYVEKTYGCGGSGKYRFTTGGSTGGWVSLALQILYPDSFNGCWSSCPDGVDFRNFQLINVYEDENAYFAKDGTEVPAKRNRNGTVDYSIRHECQLERVLGGGRWELGGQQWASWNAVYGPKGENGPIPLWDGETGEINQQTAEAWKRYDLRLILQDNWSSLRPRLAGKIHVWVGDKDEYYLNLAVERFQAMTSTLTNPAFDGEIIIEPGKGHTSGWKSAVIRDAMYQRMLGLQVDSDSRAP